MRVRRLDGASRGLGKADAWSSRVRGTRDDSGLSVLTPPHEGVTGYTATRWRSSPATPQGLLGAGTVESTPGDLGAPPLGAGGRMRRGSQGRPAGVGAPLCSSVMVPWGAVSLTRACPPSRRTWLGLPVQAAARPQARGRRGPTDARGHAARWTRSGVPTRRRRLARPQAPGPTPALPAPPPRRGRGQYLLLRGAPSPRPRRAPPAASASPPLAPAASG